MKQNCIIVGAGTYGQVYAEYLKEEYHILGFIDDNESIINKKINGFNVLGNFEYLLNNFDQSTNIFIPIGNNRIRERLFMMAESKGFSLPNYIHPSVSLDKSVILGDKGIYILQNSIIMPLTKIDNYVMISSGSIISHHTHVKSNVFISFGVNIGASLILEERAYLGIGSLIMTGIKTIGKDTTIGAGAVVIRDVPDYAVVVGNPGKIIKYNNV